MTTENAAEWPPRMGRKEASNYLFAVHGIKESPRTLANKASSGTGPVYEKQGNAHRNGLALYTPSGLDAYAEMVLSKAPARSAAEHKALAPPYKAVTHSNP